MSEQTALRLLLSLNLGHKCLKIFYAQDYSKDTALIKLLRVGCKAILALLGRGVVLQNNRERVVGSSLDTTHTKQSCHKYSTGLEMLRMNGYE